MDTADIRLSNSQMVLNYLWKLKTVSRAELSRLTGLSRPSISTLVEEFLVRGFVTELGLGQSNGGRRPVMLRFEDASFGIIGCELGAKHIRVFLCNMRGDSLSFREEACATGDDPEGTLDLLSELLLEVKTQAAQLGCYLLGIGVGLPCPVVSKQGVVTLHPAIYPRWEGIDLQAFISRLASLPVWFGNDAKLGALAELWWSEDSKLKHLLYIQLAQGLGAGVILDRKIQAGAHGLAGEIGSAADLAAYFPKVDRLTREQDLRPLAQIIANSVLTWDPEVLVLGGELSTLGAESWQKLQDLIRSQFVWPELKELVIQKSRFANHQTALGAATLVLDKFLSDASFWMAIAPQESSVGSITQKRAWDKFDDSL